MFAQHGIARSPKAQQVPGIGLVHDGDGRRQGRRTDLGVAAHLRAAGGVDGLMPPSVARKESELSGGVAKWGITNGGDGGWWEILIDQGAAADGAGAREPLDKQTPFEVA